MKSWNILVPSQGLGEMNWNSSEWSNGLHWKVRVVCNEKNDYYFPKDEFPHLEEP